MMEGNIKKQVFGSLKDAKHHMKRKSVGGEVLDRWNCLIIEINRISLGGVFNC